MYRILTITLSSLFLFACGDDDSASSSSEITPVDSFNLTDVSAGEAGKLTFTWDGDNSGLTYIVCEKDTAEDNNCSELETVTEVNTADVHIDALLDRISSEFFILASNGSATASSDETTLSSENITHLIRYLKASTSDTFDKFGYSSVLSGDGNTLAVGAYYEDSIGTGINSDSQDDNSAGSAGAVYLFRYDGTDWSQEAYIKASNTKAGNQFGVSLSLSADGNILAVGSLGEDSSSTGINSTANEDANSAGAAYIFKFTDGAWEQETYIKASNTEKGDNFGLAVSLSSDGTVLAVGTKNEDSNATGIYMDESSVSTEQANNSETSAGAVYVYRFEASNWTQEAYIKASNAEGRDYFGAALALSGDGDTLVVGAYGEDSNSGDDESNGSLSGSGAAYVFRFDDTSWTQEAYIKAATPTGTSSFGESVSLSDDGNTLAVGADDENTTEDDSGAVHVFRFTDAAWSEQAFIKASTVGEDAGFGKRVSLSADGSTLAVSAIYETSLSVGINGEETITDDKHGAAYAFEYDGTDWVQYAYIKPSNTTEDAGETFGFSVSLSDDGKTLAVGASGEDSGTVGVDGDQSQSNEETNVSSSGAVYIY